MNLLSTIRKYVVWEYNNYFVDVYIVSYPKAGRTWLRTILGKALACEYGVDFTTELTDVTSHDKRLPRIVFSHAGFLNTSIIPKRVKRFRNKKVVLLTRDPRDVVVSSFFQESKRTGRFDGDISSFVRDEDLGIRQIITFYNSWHQGEKHAGDFHLVRYEDLHTEPTKIVQQLFSFLGIAVREGSVKEAVGFSQFENMRKLEEKNNLNYRLRPADVNDLDSYKTRKGKVGGYVDYLSSEDIEFCNSAMKELSPDFGYSESQESAQ